MALNTKIRGNQIADAFFGAGLRRNNEDVNVADVNVDGSSLEINNSNALQVKALGIQTSHLANDSVDKSKINSDVAGSGIVQDVDGSLSLNPDNSSLEIVSGDVLKVKALGITNDMLAGNIDASKLAGNIADNQLATDYVKVSEIDGVTLEMASGNILQVKANSIGANEIDETDNYQFSGQFKVTTAPNDAYDVANKAYVDSVAQGLDPKQSVYAKSHVNDGNIILSGISGQTLDGQSLSADQRVLLTHQTDAKQNGIWIVKSGAWIRPNDFSTNSAVAGSFVFVEKGNTYADTGWVCINDAGSDVVDTNNLYFSQFSGAGQITVGNALSKDGDKLDVLYDDSTIGLNGSNKLYIKADGITKNEINADIAGNGILQDVDGSLKINPDNSSLEIASGEVLRVKALGITNEMLAGNISNDKLAGSISDDKLATDYVKVSELDNVTLEMASGNIVQVKALGIDTDHLANEAVTEAKIAIFNNPTTGKVLGYTSNGLEWIDVTTDAVVEADFQKENLSTLCDGAETDFSLAYTPLVNSLQVFLNGLLQEEGSNKDYVLVSGNIISFAKAPLLGDILLVNYIINN